MPLHGPGHREKGKNSTGVCFREGSTNYWVFKIWYKANQDDTWLRALSFRDTGSGKGALSGRGGCDCRQRNEDPQGLEAAAVPPTATVGHSEESSVLEGGGRCAGLKTGQNRAYFKPQQFQQLPQRCTETTHRTALSKNNMNPLVYHGVCC